MLILHFSLHASTWDVYKHTIAFQLSTPFIKTLQVVLKKPIKKLSLLFFHVHKVKLF